MTATLESLTNPELLLIIVTAEKISCGYDGDLFTRCSCEEGDCPCHSIGFKEVHGKVPILSPELMRQPCDCWCHKTRDRANGQACENSCWRCKDRLWFPIHDPWAMKKALHQAGFQLTESHAMYDYRPDAYVASCYRYLDSKAIQHVPRIDADPERVRLLAIAGAMVL